MCVMCCFAYICVHKWPCVCVRNETFHRQQVLHSHVQKVMNDNL